MAKEVLVIHNDFESGAFAESNAGLKEEVDAVCNALKQLKVKHSAKSINSLEQLPHILSENKQRIIFNLVEELPGDITFACYIPAVCRAFEQKFTGGDTPALLLAQNKGQTKAILKAAGIPTPDGVVVGPDQKKHLKDLSPGKYIVKPAFSDASEGIEADSIVNAGGKKLLTAVEKIHKQFNQPAIVEQFIPARELNVSLLQRDGKVEVLAIAEIDFSAFDKSKPKIVGYSAKWQPDSFEYNNTPRILPARLSAKTAKLVRQYAVDAWGALGCKDYARVDFRLDEQGRPFVLEVNPNPDISPDAGFAAAVDFAGMSYKQFVEILLINNSR